MNEFVKLPLNRKEQAHCNTQDRHRLIFKTLASLRLCVFALKIICMVLA